MPTTSTYTTSKAQAGRGSQLYIGAITGTTTGTETFTLIGEIKSSGITGAQWDQAETSNFESGSDREYISTMRNPGMVKMAGNRIASDAGQQAVEAAFATGLKYDFKEVLPINLQAGQTTTGDTFTFSALVMDREITVDFDKIVDWNVTLKISGPVTITVGS